MALIVNPLRDALNFLNLSKAILSLCAWQSNTNIDFQLNWQRALYGHMIIIIIIIYMDGGMHWARRPVIVYHYVHIIILVSLNIFQ